MGPGQPFAEMFATLAGTASWLGYAAQRRPPAVAGRRPTPERVALAHRMAAGSLSGSPAEIGERWRREQAAAANDASPVGVLLLSVGAPASADDVEEYLYNVFCDPEILTLPPALMWALKRPVAWVSTNPSPSPSPEPHPHLTRRSHEPGPSPNPAPNPSPNPDPHQAISKWRAPAARAAMLQASPNTTQVIERIGTLTLT